MRKKRAHYDDIAHKLNCERQWIARVVKKLTALYGSTLLKPSEELWTTREAARELEVDQQIVAELCLKKDIQARRNGNHWLVTEQGMDDLRVHPRITGERTCPMCGTVFGRERGQNKVCSQECRQLRNRHYANSHYAKRKRERS